MKKIKITAIFLAIIICVLALTSCKDESGVPNGLFKEWDENGTLRSEFPYVNGRVNGIARMYDADGLLSEDLELVNGIREGVYHKYKKGIVVHTAKFHRNRCVENCEF